MFGMQTELRFFEGHKEQCLVEIQSADSFMLFDAKPTGEFGGKVNFNVGEDDQEDIKALVNLPAMLNGTLATKISAMSFEWRRLL